MRIIAVGLGLADLSGERGELGDLNLKRCATIDAAFLLLECTSQYT